MRAFVRSSRLTSSRQMLATSGSMFSFHSFTTGDAAPASKPYVVNGRNGRAGSSATHIVDNLQSTPTSAAQKPTAVAEAIEAAKVVAAGTRQSNAIATQGEQVTSPAVREEQTTAIGEPEEKLRIGFIGAGSMAGAMAGGLHSAEIFEKYMFSDINDETLDKMTSSCPGCKITNDNEEILRKCDVVVLAVKPQYLADVMTPKLRALFKPSHLVISIMAGVSLDKMKSYIGDNVPIIRTMPNTPLLVKKGSTAFAGNEHVTETHCNLVQEMFTSIGKCVQVKENMLDAVTGVSGSGPAFVTMFIEAMADGGVYAGLPRNIALELATNTVLGTATLIAEKGMHPAVAKDMVTSPGGTTIYGLRELEDGKFRATIINAVNAAAQQASALNSKK